MLFNSLVFFLFLPATLFLFYASKLHVHLSLLKWILIASSLFFCGWNTPWFISVLTISTVVTYLSVRWMNYFQKTSLLYKLSFYFGVFGSLGNLIFWKYTDPLFLSINATGLLELSLLEIILPLGISFFTLQGISHLTDVYRKQAKIESNIFNLT